MGTTRIRVLIVAAALALGTGGGAYFAQRGDGAERVTLPTACDNLAAATDDALAGVSVTGLLTNPTDADEMISAVEASCRGTGDLPAS